MLSLSTEQVQKTIAYERSSDINIPTKKADIANSRYFFSIVVATMGIMRKYQYFLM